MSIPNIGDDGQSVSDIAFLQVAKGSALILLGLILARVLGFLRQFLVIRMLSPKYYGLFALSLTIINIIIIVSFLGLYQGAQRFIAYNMDKNDYPKVTGTIRASMWITSTASVFFMVLLMVFASSLSRFFAKPELKSLILIMAPMVPFQVVAVMITAVFLGLHNPAPKVWIEDIGFGVTSIIAVLISLSIARSLNSLAIAMSASFFLVLLISMYVYRSRFPLDMRTLHASPVTKQLLYFSLPLFLSSALYVAMGNTDTIVVGHFMASDRVGFYNVAFLLMTLIPIFYVAVSIIYLPVATSLIAKRAQTESLRLYQSSTRWSFILTVPLFLTFFLFPTQTLYLLFGGRYTVAATALSILSLGAFINAFLGPNNYALIAYGETRMVLYGSLTATAIDIVLNLLLVPRIGISGAAIATASALGVANIMYSSLLWVKHKLHPFESRYVFTVLFLSAMGVAFYIPLRMAINRAHWLVLMVYPLFLMVGLLFIIVTRSVTEEDKLLWRLVREQLRRGSAHKVL